MKLVKIYQNNLVREFRAIDPTDHIQMCVASNVWGLPERPELDADGNPTGNTLPAEYTIEIEDISAEHELQECISKRIAEYPTFGDFMNAFFDGDQEANLEALRQARLAIKQKYPKPTGGQ